MTGKIQCEVCGRLLNKKDKYYTLFERTIGEYLKRGRRLCPQCLIKYVDNRKRRTMKVTRIKKVRKSQMKAQKKLMKATNERIWIEQNPHIHILNYPFYKLVRIIKQRREHE